MGLAVGGVGGVCKEWLRGQVGTGDVPGRG